MKEPMQEPGTLVSDTQATTDSLPSLLSASHEKVEGLDCVSPGEGWTDETLLRTALYAWQDVDVLADFHGTLKQFKEVLEQLETRFGADAFVCLHNDGDYASRFRAATRHSLIAQAMSHRQRVAKCQSENEVRERQELARLKAKYETHEHIQKP